MRPDIEPESQGLPSKRIQQLNSLLQKEVAELLLRQMEWPSGTIVTVTKASVADDAESAKIWLSVLPVDRGQAALGLVNAHIRELQTVLNKKLVMKFVPKLIFALDTSAEKAETIDHILDRLDHQNGQLE